MRKDVSRFVNRVKEKTKRLKRALVRELGEEVLLGQCRDWVSTAYGFVDYNDLIRNHQARHFIFDEYASEAELSVRLSAQAASLSFDFDLDDSTARALIAEIRPTAAGNPQKAEGAGLQGASITISHNSVAVLKKLLRAEFPTAKSSHLSEAIAAFLGFKTSIAFVTALRESSDRLEIARVWPERLIQRLYEVDPVAAIHRAGALDLRELVTSVAESNRD